MTASPTGRCGNAYCLIRNGPAYRHDAFVAGLKRAGYTVRHDTPRPEPGNVLVIWNRYGKFDRYATAFEQAGCHVLVVENGYLGRDWRGSHWYAISRNRHNGGGTWFHGGPERWDSWNIEIKPWRERGDHVLVLPQRGIGMPPVAQPGDWIPHLKNLETQRRVVYREHPGERKPHETLYDDLRGAHCAITWASGAGLKALLNGIPVFYGFEQWIGAPAGKPFTGSVEDPFMGDRLPMFQRLAWAMWRLDEIENGDPFRGLLC